MDPSTYRPTPNKYTNGRCDGHALKPCNSSTIIQRIEQELREHNLGERGIQVFARNKGPKYQHDPSKKAVFFISHPSDIDQDIIAHLFTSKVWSLPLMCKDECDAVVSSQLFTYAVSSVVDKKVEGGTLSFVARFRQGIETTSAPLLQWLVASHLIASGSPIPTMNPPENMDEKEVDAKILLGPNSIAFTPDPKWKDNSPHTPDSPNTFDF